MPTDPIISVVDKVYCLVFNHSTLEENGIIHLYMDVQTYMHEKLACIF